MSWHDRVFRIVMRLLPSEFRGDYEREMAATFRAERHAAVAPSPCSPSGPWPTWPPTPFPFASHTGRPDS